MKVKTILALSCLVLVCAWTSQAALIAHWTFETGTTGNPPNGSGTDITGLSPAAGIGVASGKHASSSTVWDNPAGNGSAESLSANNWAIGDYFQFSVSTVGYFDINLSWEQTRSSTGPQGFDLAYSTDGTTFTVFSGYTVQVNGAVGGGTWSTLPANYRTDYKLDYDLSSIASLDNEASVFFRLIATTAPGGTGGTSRLDDFTINATPVPEPSTLIAGALLALPFGVHGVRYLRNRKRA